MKPLFRAALWGVILFGTPIVARNRMQPHGGTSGMSGSARDSVCSDSTVVDSAVIAAIERDMILLRNLDLISELELYKNYDLLNDEEFDVSDSNEKEIETIPSE